MQAIVSVLVQAMVSVLIQAMVPALVAQVVVFCGLRLPAFSSPP